MAATVRVKLYGYEGDLPDVSIEGTDAEVYEVLDTPDFSKFLALLKQRGLEFQGIQALVETLGAEVVEVETKGEAPPPWQRESASEGRTEDAWDIAARERSQAQEKAPEPAEDNSLEQLINEASSLEEIKSIWIDHGDDIKNKNLTSQWQAKAKQLKNN